MERCFHTHTHTRGFRHVKTNERTNKREACDQLRREDEQEEEKEEEEERAPDVEDVVVVVVTATTRHVTRSKKKI